MSEMTKEIDDVLAAFQDGKWHSLEEVAQHLELDEFKAAIVFEFLAEYNFIEIDEKGVKAKLVPQYQTFCTRIKQL